MKWALESPTERALLRARCQGPRPLPAVLRNSPENSQRDQCRSATPWCFPLAPKSCPQSQPDPASESDQLLRCFAKAEITAPAPHIPGQLFHCRLHADALGPSRDLPDSLLEPFQRFPRNRAPYVRTAVKLNPRNFRSCGRATALFASFTLSLIFCVMKREMLSITRWPARSL